MTDVTKLAETSAVLALAVVVAGILWQIIFKFVVVFVRRVMDEAREREDRLMTHQEAMTAGLQELSAGQQALCHDVREIKDTLDTHLKEGH